MKDDKGIDDKFVRDFLKKSSGPEFKVPDNYFEGFQKSIRSKINRDSTLWWKLPQVKIGLSILSSLVLVFFIFKGFPQKKELAEVELNKKELLAYFSENIDEISELELLEVLEDKDFIVRVIQVEQSDSLKIDKKKEEKNKVSPSLEDFTDEEIYEYMLDEGYGSGEWDNL